MPKIEKTRLEYQNAAASQYASSIAFQEKEPMVAAARMALWNNANGSAKEHILSNSERANAQMDKCDLQRWKRTAIPRAFGSASDPDDGLLWGGSQVMRCTLR